MTYKIQKAKNLFQVIELKTEKVVGEFNSHDEANTFYRSLKDGAGFAGWTPDFFK